MNESQHLQNWEISKNNTQGSQHVYLNFHTETIDFAQSLCHGQLACPC